MQAYVLFFLGDVCLYNFLGFHVPDGIDCANYGKLFQIFVGTDLILEIADVLKTSKKIKKIRVFKIILFFFGRLNCSEKSKQCSSMNFYYFIKISKHEGIFS